MKQLAYKISRYLKILAYKLRFEWQEETAYAINTLGDLSSAFFYNATFIIFLTIILRKVKTIAGYDFNDMLVFTFFTQILVYFSLAFTNESMDLLINYVKSGVFDSLIIKPTSLLFQVLTLKMRPFSGILFSGPPLALYVILIIRANTFHPNAFSVIMGSLSLALGFVILHLYRFDFALLVFWMKQNKNLIKTINLLNDLGAYPYEAYRQPLRTILACFSPLIAGSGVSATYFLGKTTSFEPFIFELCFLGVIILIGFVLWKNGLKIYESASS